MSQRTPQEGTGIGGSGGETMEYGAGIQQGFGGAPTGGQQPPRMGGQQQYQPSGQQQYQPGGQQSGASGGQQQYQSTGQQTGFQPGGGQSIQSGGAGGIQPSGQQVPQVGGQQQLQPGGQQQFGTGGQAMSQPPASEFEDSLTSDMRLALHDFVQAATVCEWCADRCVTEGPEMAECIRLCRDVADLAVQNVQFMARDSPFGPELAETFALAAEECANECARHGHSHCQECASVLGRAVESTWRMLESIESQQGGVVQQPQGY